MKIICFSSYTSIWHYAFPEAIVAHELQKRGHEVLYITPGNEFPGKSNPMNESILKKGFGLNGYDIGGVLTGKDREKMASLMKDLNQDNFEDLVIDGVNIGKTALYETLLNYKKMSIDFNGGEWKECLSEIKNTLTSFYACRKILKKEKPDRILVYNALYSVNHVWERYANFKGIPVYFLSNGGNLSDMENTLIIAKNDAIDYMNKLKNIWSELKDIPISQEMLNYVTNHFLELFKAKNRLVYSAPKSGKKVSIRKIFNIKNNQKILVATMSSYDELFAAQYVGAWNTPKDLMFLSQVLWIKALIGYVKNRKDLFLLVRVHPREFPNKRDSVKSEHAKTLEKEFNNLPKNVKVNWPMDNISIYDLAQETDVFLNAWSTVGMEMSLLGIPVVIYSKDLIFYPSDLNYVGKDRNDYFKKIDLALKDGWSYEKIKKTYRWLGLYYYQTIMRLGRKRPELKRPIIIKLFFDTANYLYGLLPLRMKTRLTVEKTQAVCREQLAEYVDISRVEKMLYKCGDTLVNMKAVLTAGVTKKEEDVSLRYEVKRIYRALYGQLLKGGKIKKNSLQYNLKGVIKANTI